MAKIICLAQSKGGTSKTSSVLNIGSSLVQGGAKVLAVDVDQQSSLTIALGVNPLDLNQTMHALLTDPAVKAKDILVSTHEGIDLLPADIDLSTIEFSMKEIVGREKALAKKLRPLASDYDYILIDTPPSFALTTLNAMAASNYLLIPLQPEPLCIHGLRHLTQTFSIIQENSNPGLSILGLFITMYDNRLRGHREIAEQIRQDWGELAFKSVIRRRSNILEATVEGRATVSMQPASDLAQDYRQLTEEVVARAE